MNRKIIKVMAILQMILCLVTYFSMSYHFDADVVIYKMLENTDVVATLLRLSLYAIPGIHLLSSLYGLVFDDKKILVIISVVELIASVLTFTYVSSSEYMLILSIITVSIAAIYFISVLTIKNK